MTFCASIDDIKAFVKDAKEVGEGYGFALVLDKYGGMTVQALDYDLQDYDVEIVQMIEEDYIDHFEDNWDRLFGWIEGRLEGHREVLASDPDMMNMYDEVFEGEKYYFSLFC